MKRLVTLMIILGVFSGMISCNDDFAAVEKNVIENEGNDSGGDGNGDGNDGGGGGLPG